MKDTTLIISSAIAILFAIIFNSIPDKTSGALGLTFLILAFASWLTITYMVFKDAKEKGISTGYAGFGLILGGVGGLLYVLMSKDASAKKVKHSSKNLQIFSLIMAIIFGLALLLTMPWTSNQVINWGVTIFVLVFFVLSLLMMWWAKKH